MARSPLGAPLSASHRQPDSLGRRPSPACQELDAAEEKKYATDAQGQVPWAVEHLGVRPRGSRPFYPLSDFRVFASLSASSQLTFPAYLQLSSNYYNPSWWREPRRLKNVIMTMEWVPGDVDEGDGAAAAGCGAPSADEIVAEALSEEQQQRLRDAFDLIDLDRTGSISTSQVRHACRGRPAARRTPRAPCRVPHAPGRPWLPPPVPRSSRRRSSSNSSAPSASPPLRARPRQRPWPLSSARRMPTAAAASRLARCATRYATTYSASSTAASSAP